MTDLGNLSEAGYNAIFLTVDAAFLGKRLNEYRNSFAMPKGTVYPNLGEDINCDNLDVPDDRTAYETALDWAETAAFMRKHTKLPVWIKGGAQLSYGIICAAQKLTSNSVHARRCRSRDPTRL